MKKSHNPWIAVAIVLGIVALLLLNTAQKPKPETQKASTPKIGWTIADSLLQQRQRYEASTSTQGLPGWASFTEAYFQALKARREAMIDWASSTNPTILFMGQIHLNIAGSQPTPDAIQRVEGIQTRIFERLRARAESVQVIAIEEAGCEPNEVVTPTIFTRIAKQSARDLYGIELPEEQIGQMMRQDRQAATRAVMELGATPVTCGEEWPNWLQTKLMQRRPSSQKEQILTKDLITLFTRLRSEIILIRTLEFLRSRNGSKGIILQGDWHRPDIVSLVPEYHIQLTTFPPD